MRMDNSIRLLGIFQTGFTVFLVLAIIFLILSVILFVKFDIRGIWQMRSGKARNRAIREKEEEAAKSGNIRSVRRPAPELQRSGELNVGAEESGKPVTGPISTERTHITPPEKPQMQPTSQQLRDGTTLTTVLKPEERQAGTGKFIIEKQIIFIHTEEVI